MRVLWENAVDINLVFFSNICHIRLFSRPNMLKCCAPDWEKAPQIYSWSTDLRIFVNVAIQMQLTAYRKQKKESFVSVFTVQWIGEFNIRHQIYPGNKSHQNKSKSYWAGNSIFSNSFSNFFFNMESLFLLWNFIFLYQFVNQVSQYNTIRNWIQFKKNQKGQGFN